MIRTSKEARARIVLAAILAASCLTGAAAQAQKMPAGFVYLRDIDPTIIQDMRYAGSNNFVGRPLRGYEAAECVVKREVGALLKSVQEELALHNLSLKMFDCYRPTRAVADMVAWSRDGKETVAGNATTRRSARPTCFGSATSPNAPAIPPAPRSISPWSI